MLFAKSEICTTKSIEERLFVVACFVLFETNKTLYSPGLPRTCHPLPSECWDYKCAMPSHTGVFNGALSFHLFVKYLYSK
jgi:hypothetical protein